MKKFSILILFILIFANMDLFSQKGDEALVAKPKPKSPSNVFNTSITISPMHLAMPVVELMAEFAVKPRLSVALIGGLGTYEGFSVYEMGGQLNFYLIGNFDVGMQGGIEVLYASVSGSRENVSGIGQGLAFGPYIGYKGAFSFGLSLNIQLGFQIMSVSAEAEGSTASAKGAIPLLNLNLGWSF